MSHKLTLKNSKYQRFPELFGKFPIIYSKPNYNLKRIVIFSGRSNTWPVVVVNLGKNGCTTTTQLDGNFNERTPLESTNGPVSSCAGTVLDPRKVATLSRHYYPEGGWGWVVLGCCVIVHVLNHGLQLSFGMLIVPINLRFKSVYEHTGKI